MVFIIILVLYFLLFIYIFMQFVKSYHIKMDRVTLFTGTMGSGKTYLAVSKAIALRAKVSRKLWFKRLWSYILHRKKSKHFHYVKPVIYSNIPLRSKWYRMLTVDMLLRREEMQENCIILIDEFGGIVADQYAWNNPFVIDHLTAFIRFCRHWLDAYLILTDQTSESIVKSVRDRLSVEYHLSFFRRKFFKFYKIDIVPVQHITSDTSNVLLPEDDKQLYVFGFFNKKHPRYDTRCYKPSYLHGFVFDPELNIVDQPLQTRYLYDIDPSVEDNKLYKNDKKSARRKFYGAPLCSSEGGCFSGPSEEGPSSGSVGSSAPGPELDAPAGEPQQPGA